MPIRKRRFISLFLDATLVVNRRKYGRIGIGDQSCAIHMNGEVTDGHIINESIGGIRIGGIPLLHLFMNQDFTIQYDDVSVTGLSRTVSRGKDDFFEIGLVRDEHFDGSSSDATLVNSFWNVDGVSFVCFPRSIVDEETMLISFPDGKEFEVPIEDVVQMTRDERGEYLLDAEIRAKVGEVYAALYSNSNMFGDRISILNHEFGPEPKN